MVGRGTPGFNYFSGTSQLGRERGREDLLETLILQHEWQEEERRKEG